MIDSENNHIDDRERQAMIEALDVALGRMEPSGENQALGQILQRLLLGAERGALAEVLTLDEVLAILRTSRATWFRAKRAGFPLVPEIEGVPGRFSREAVLARIARAATGKTRSRRPVDRQHRRTVGTRGVQ